MMTISDAMGPSVSQQGWGAAVLVAAMCLLGGCGGKVSDAETDRPRFVTTIPPFEMILSRLVDGRGTVERLLEPGASPHTYDPTPSDLRATTTATALVYGADALDGWAADLPAPRQFELVSMVPVGARLSFEGEHGTTTVDPHFWTDPLTVKQLVPVLADTLCAVDPNGCSTYRANADSFTTTLATLDARIRALTASGRKVPVLLAQPFFRYFLHRYGPRLVGIVEPSPGGEATPRQLRRLVGRVQATGAEAILTQQSLSGRAAQAVSEAAGIPVVKLDPLGGTDGRRTYDALLRFNARTLNTALAPPAPQ